MSMRDGVWLATSMLSGEKQESGTRPTRDSTSSTHHKHCPEQRIRTRERRGQSKSRKNLLSVSADDAFLTIVR